MVFLLTFYYLEKVGRWFRFEVFFSMMLLLKGDGAGNWQLTGSAQHVGGA
jgi:hypothetical protein